MSKTPDKVVVEMRMPIGFLRSYVGKNAGDLRELGFVIPEKIPDCALLGVGEEFKWVSVEFEIE